MGFLFNDGNFAFVGSTLHPFLLIIAFGAFYGLPEAMLCAVMSVGLYFLGLAITENTVVPAGGAHFKMLFSFVICGVVLGLAQNARNRQLASTRSELEEIRNESERLRQRLQVVNAANQKLNERILGEVTTVQSFADIARRLSVLEERDLYPAVCDLARDFVHASEASVYMLQGDKLVLTAQRGWESVPNEAKVLYRANDLLWNALDKGRPLTALDLELPPQNEDDPSRRYRRLMAAPIVHPQTGKVVGVLSVDRLPFSEFHGNSLGMLGVIAKWAGDSLYNASTFREVANQLAGDDAMPGCLAPVLFKDRIQQEITREDAGPVSCAVIMVQGLQALPEAEQLEIRKSIYGKVQPMLEGRTVIGRMKDGVYGVLMPGRDAATAQKVRDQLAAAFKDLGSSKVTIMIGSSSLKPENAEPEALLRDVERNMVTS